MKNALKITCLTLVTAILASCTNEQIYKSIQQNRQSACPTYPDSVYLACIQRHSVRYDDYKNSLPKDKSKDY